jgi:hypothetical protein
MDFKKACPGMNKINASREKFYAISRNRWCKNNKIKKGDQIMWLFQPGIHIGVGTGINVSIGVS